MSGWRRRGGEKCLCRGGRDGKGVKEGGGGGVDEQERGGDSGGSSKDRGDRR